MLSAKYPFEAIGTTWSIDTARPLTSTEIQAVTSIIVDFDKTYSRFRNDSLVHTIRQESPGSFDFPDSIHPLYDIYKKLWRATAGRINPLVGVSLEQLGYDENYSFVPHDRQPAPDFHTMTKLGAHLTFAEKTSLDIGAIGKGYLTDRVAELLSYTHDDYVVDASGDMTVCTKTPEIIGLEHPFDASRVIGTVSLSSGSLCASATNRRTWGENLHHIIDATTGKPVESDIVAVWVIANSALMADALTSGLFFADPTQLQQVFGDFHYIIMKKDGSVTHTITSDTGEIFI